MSARNLVLFNGAPFDPEAVIRASRVTDHALVRWLERAEGYPVAAWRRAIMSRPAVLQGLALGASGVQLPDLGVRLLIDRGRIVTVLPMGEPE